MQQNMAATAALDGRAPLAARTNTPNGQHCAYCDAPLMGRRRDFCDATCRDAGRFVWQGALPDSLTRVAWVDGKGYARLQGGRKQHVAVAEAMLMRPLRTGEVVHHWDEDKGNSGDPANLGVMMRPAHSRLHQPAMNLKRVRNGTFRACLKDDTWVYSRTGWLDAEGLALLVLYSDRWAMVRNGVG